MTSPKSPAHEWRLNTSMGKVFPDTRFYDLFLDGKYQNIWMEEKNGKLSINRHHEGKILSMGSFDSLQEAEEYLIVMDVVARFEKAYGGTIHLSCSARPRLHEPEAKACIKNLKHNGLHDQTTQE